MCSSYTTATSLAVNSLILHTKKPAKHLQKSKHLSMSDALFMRQPYYYIACTPIVWYEECHTAA